MITRNFENMLATTLQGATSGVVFGTLPVTDVTGQVWYKAVNWGSTCFPTAATDAATLDPAAAGVSVGTGSAAPTPFDVNLKQTLTGGISLAVSAVVPGADSPGNPWIRYHLTVTNTSTAPVTVREVGFKQTIRVKRRPGPDSNLATMTNRVCLLDRTVLAEPVTIAPGDAGVILYKLRTNATPARTVGGVEIASWTWGTDAQIAAMLDAARAGTIDLQTDALWRVGDLRMVSVGAFASPSVNHNARTVPLVISDFAEYEGCGSVLQFDFYETLTQKDRMNTTTSNVGGYGGSEMYLSTLPALAAALPTWLRTRLRTFSVKASEGNKSSAIETVSGNLLALRSEAEITGGNAYSFAGEGTRAALYRVGVNAKKLICGNYADASDYWLRSPDSTTTRFCRITTQGTPTNNLANTSGIAVFGCL